MSVTVDFYTFSKKVNSTARPTGQPSATYNCILKHGCGVMSPVISLDLGLATNPQTLNYCYISDFGRYYFVKEWTWEERLWHIYLEEDLLATWKTEINATSCYVLRSASTYDGLIMDELYPTKPFALNKVNQATSNPWPADLASGYYVVGIINMDSSAVGAVSYYVMTNNQFKTFCTSLMQNTNWLNVPNDFLNGGMDENLLKTLFNPIQYVASCKWYPFAPPTSGSVSDLPYGWWTLNGVSASRLDPDGVASVSFTIAVPDHPQATTRGEYLNSSPYTRLTLYAGPFGEMTIDPDIYTRTQSIRCDIACDCISGIGTMELNVDILSSYPNTITNVVQTQMAVDIQIAQMGVDRLSQAETIVTGTYDTLASGLQTAAAATNITNLLNPVAGVLSTAAQGAQAVSTGVHAIANGIRASVPQLQSSGINGSIACYQVRPHLRAEFYELVAEDLPDNGRPLCQVKQLSSLTGFVMVKDGNVELPGTLNEGAAVKAYLESGVFLE